MRSRLRKLSLVLGWACCGAALPVAAQSPLPPGQPDEVPWEAYTEPQQLVTVAPNRRLNLLCLGSGSPTVVLEPGAGGDISSWRMFHKRVSAVTRTCVYDRAGYGFSDPPTRPSSPPNLADDLHRLLAGSAIPRPVVLVGHSAGGLYAVLDADRHQSDLAGMVLIDPTVAEQAQFQHALETPEEARKVRTEMVEALAGWTDCSTRARAGEDPQVISTCFNKIRPDAPATLRAGMLLRYNRAQVYEARTSEIGALDAFLETYRPPQGPSARPAKAAWGDLPLIVLHAANSTVGAYSPETNSKDRAMKLAARERLASRSTAGKLIVVQGAGHQIPREKPDAVVAAIREVVEAVRAQTKAR